MGKYAVAAIDGTSARFFSLDSALSSEYESSPNLLEHKGLSDATKELHGQELWANTKTGRNRGSSSQAHAYDDHRQSHEREFEKRFANKISNALIDLVKTHQAKHLIIVAEPEILGIMREVMSDNFFKSLNLKEVAKDICHFNVRQIHDYLAKKNLLPPCQKVYFR